MRGQTDGWRDGWTGGQVTHMDGWWRDGERWVQKYVDGEVDGCVGGLLGGWTGRRRTCSCLDGWWKDGWTGVWTAKYLHGWEVDG